MIHPDTKLRFVSPVIGHGVVAERLIPRGTITWITDSLDIILNPIQVEQLPAMMRQHIDHYAFINHQGEAILCWDIARYVNHSCEPSTLSIGSLCTIAVRDIQPGEQITEDYATLNLINDLQCVCGAKSCRGRIGPHELEVLAPGFDRQARSAIELIPDLTQPLLQIADPVTVKHLLDISSGIAPMPSCFDNYFDMQVDQKQPQAHPTSA